MTPQDDSSNLHTNAVMLGKLEVMVGEIRNMVTELRDAQHNFVTLDLYKAVRQDQSNQIEVLASAMTQFRQELRSLKKEDVDPVLRFVAEIKGGLRTVKFGLSLLAAIQVGFYIWFAVHH